MSVPIGKAEGLESRDAAGVLKPPSPQWWSRLANPGSQVTNSDAFYCVPFECFCLLHCLWKENASLLTNYDPPGRLWPPINTALAWSNNQNGIWKENSSWQNEKHIPCLYPALSNGYNWLHTPFFLLPLDFFRHRAILSYETNKQQQKKNTQKVKTQAPQDWSHFNLKRRK